MQGCNPGWECRVTFPILHLKAWLFVPLHTHSPRPPLSISIPHHRLLPAHFQVQPHVSKAAHPEVSYSSFRAQNDIIQYWSRSTAAVMQLPPWWSSQSQQGSTKNAWSWSAMQLPRDWSSAGCESYPHLNPAGEQWQFYNTSLFLISTFCSVHDHFA